MMGTIIPPKAAENACIDNPRRRLATYQVNAFEYVSTSSKFGHTSSVSLSRMHKTSANPDEQGSAHQFVVAKMSILLLQGAVRIVVVFHFHQLNFELLSS
mmetsp:Transcript_48286/g.145958  ORF Transcript_48286/g.145958 Transcript_48286/m.145958 type:complete len:100 (+) Transcript_48286:237-536(+)